jgi:CheY-like chemotaxis protein
MPVMNGFELREMIINDPLIKTRNVPYIFFTTSSMLKVVSGERGGNSMQGIFKKPDRHAEWKDTLMAIVKYWTLSMPPDEYKL